MSGANEVQMIKQVSLSLCAFVSLCFYSLSVSAQSANPLRQLVTTYCVSCHNDRLKTGNLALDKADADQVFNSAETWEKVVVKLRSRSMPPVGNRRPDNVTYDTVATWLENELDRAADADVHQGRAAHIHRLNRWEDAYA